MALLQLTTSSSQSDIDIAGSGDISSWGEGTFARAYGYGRFNNTYDPYQFSKYHRRAEFNIDNLATDHTRILASYTGRTACHMDSGGPVIATMSSGVKQIGTMKAVEVSGTYPDELICNLGGTQTWMKAGYRGTETNSPLWYWIQDIT